MIINYRVNPRLLRWIFGMVLLLGYYAADAQVVLYMEIMTEEKPIKYYAGQTLMYKHKDYPKEWDKVKIERILDEEKMIIYEGGIIKLEDIIQVRRVRKWVDATGYMLQTFGVSWLTFGGLAHLFTMPPRAFTFGLDTLIIGATAIVSGWLLRKLFRYKKYKIGRQVRLKILDLSWPEPRG